MNQIIINILSANPWSEKGNLVPSLAFLGQFLAKLFDFQIALIWGKLIWTIQFVYLIEIFLLHFHLNATCSHENFSILRFSFSKVVAVHSKWLFLIFSQFSCPRSSCQFSQMIDLIYFCIFCKRTKCCITNLCILKCKKCNFL